MAEQTQLKIERPQEGGYTFRGATLNDAEQAAKLVYTRMLEETGITPAVTVNHILNEWGAPDFVPETATLAAFSPDGQMVALYEVWDTARESVNPFVWGYVHPD